MIEKVDLCLDNSFKKFDSICPKSNVLAGIFVRDAYHERSYSLLTLCQMLWAVTSSGIKPKTYYLTMEFLRQLNDELSAENYYTCNDRVFNDSFALWALTCSGQPVDSNVFRKSVTTLLDKQSIDGWWGTYSEGPAHIRATAFSILALAECYSYACPSESQPYSRIFESLKKGVTWLYSQFSAKGFCEREMQSLEVDVVQKTYGVELTAFATLAILRSLKCLSVNDIAIDKYKSLVVKSLKWIISLEVEDIARVSEIELEVYKENGNLLKHDYGAGGLDIVIFVISDFFISDYYTFIEKLKKKLDALVYRLIKNENHGEWYDKNSSSYNHIWPVSYAIVALTSYSKYLDSSVFYRKTRHRNTVDLLCKVKVFIFKYVLNPVLDAIYLIIAAVLFYFHEFFNNRIDFINSTAISIVGLILGLIGLIFPRIEKYYEEHRK